MSNHRTSNLADPTNADDAVTRRYVASRFQGLNDEAQDNKSKLDALQNLFGGENNQVLIRKYEIIDTDFKHFIRLRIDEEGTNTGTSFLFRKHPHEPDDTNTYKYFNLLLKNILYIY